MKKQALLASLMVVLAAACNQSNAETNKAPAKATPAPVKAAKASATEAPRTAPGTPGSSLADSAGSYAVDSVHSQVVFSVKHSGVSNQFGMFTRVEGSFSIDPANLAASEIDITIPTASVFTAVKKRDDHLRSPDFFDAKQFPKATFKSKRIKATGVNTYDATGELTLRGVTKPVTIALVHGGSAQDPKMMGGKFRVGFNGTVTIKRTDFGMSYMLGGLGDEVSLQISIEGTRN